VYCVLWLYALIFKVRIYIVTPELSDHPATWISDNKATGVSLITLQLRGSISDRYVYSDIAISDIDQDLSASGSSPYS
jgi:hypothetical protein